MFSFRFRMISIAIVLMLAGAAVRLARAQSSTQPPAKTRTRAATSTAPVPGAAPVISTDPRAIYPPELGETPEHRKERLGTQEDPGPDPNGDTIWIRFGGQFKIVKFERKFAAFDTKRDNWVRPRADVNIPAEIYRQDADSVWVWLQVNNIPSREEIQAQVNPTSGKKYFELSPDKLELMKQFKAEFVATRPADSGVTLTFHDSSDGLPKSGSWRNSLAVGDMNEDGKLDLILPPQRGGAGGTPPYIYLGDGKGHWTEWKDVKWPMPTGYGSVSVGDLNHDGHLDVVSAMHLRGLKAFLGDGKGNFIDSSEALPDTFPTRRAVLADVNGDGYLDIVALSELTAGSNTTLVAPPYLRAYLNDGHARIWKRIDIGGPLYQMGGDWLTVGNFNGDKIPDFATSSAIFSSPDTIYVNGPKKDEWTGVARGVLPFYSYYWANTAGKFVSKDRDDLVASYERTWPGWIDPTALAPPAMTRISGLELIRFNGKTLARTPVSLWEGTSKITGMSCGDFDGDGNLDIIYWHRAPKEFVILLGDGHGGFKKASVVGLASEDRALYDIKVADVNGDGRPDVMVMYESRDSAMVKDGSVHVFLNDTPGRPKGTKKGAK